MPLCSLQNVHHSRGCSHGIFPQYIKCLCKLIFLVTLHKKCCAWWLNYLLRILEYLCCQDRHPHPAGRVPAAARVRSQGALHGRARPGQVRANENRRTRLLVRWPHTPLWLVRFGLGGAGESEAEERLTTAKLRDAANILLVLQSELLRWSYAILTSILYWIYDIHFEIDTCPQNQQFWTEAPDWMSV